MDKIGNIYSTLRDIMDNKSDPRTTDLFMMSSPLPTMAVSLTYIFIVKVLFKYFEKSDKIRYKIKFKGFRTAHHEKQKSI
jgi:hypothetical protein